MAHATNLAMEEFWLPADTAGTRLSVHDKRPAGVTWFSSERILLYVHGATYPTETSFDLRLNGVCWMEILAECGFVVYVKYAPGLRPLHPAARNCPAHRNPPIVRTKIDTGRALSSALDIVLKSEGGGTVHL